MLSGSLTHARMRRLATMPAIAVLLAAGCGDDDEPAGVATTTSVPPSTTSTTARSTTTTADSREAAEDVVAAFVDAVGSGDLEAAWDLLAERSRADVGGFAGFEGLASGLAEGYGAWSAAEDRSIRVVDVGEGVLVAALTGTVPLEGPPARHAEAIVLREDGDSIRVSPFEDVEGDPVPTFEPVTGTPLQAGAPVHVQVAGELGVQVIIGTDPPSTPEPVASANGDAVYELHVPPQPIDGQASGELFPIVVVVADDERDTRAFAAGYELVERAASPEDIARSFVEAWQAGDDEQLASLGEADAVAAARAVETDADRSWSFERCEGAAGSVFCSWRDGDASVVLQVRNVDPPRLVTGFELST